MYPLESFLGLLLPFSVPVVEIKDRPEGHPVVVVRSSRPSGVPGHLE